MNEGVGKGAGRGRRGDRGGGDAKKGNEKAGKEGRMAPAELPRGAGKTAVAIEKKHRQPQKKECAAGEPVRAGAVRGDWGGGKRFITTQTIAAVSSKAARVFTKHAGCGKGMPVCFWRAAALRKKSSKALLCCKEKNRIVVFFLFKNSSLCQKAIPRIRPREKRKTDGSS